MGVINPNKYVLDLTGTNTSNLITDENVVLGTTKVRVFTPINGPFFQESLVIKDLSTNLTLTSNQYRCLLLVPTASSISGKAVYSIIAITDQNVGQNLLISYQTVGGDFNQSLQPILDLIDALINDNRPSDWGSIIDRQDLFNPTQHMHPLGDTLGWEYLAYAIQLLSTAILLGDNVKKEQVLTYLDDKLNTSNAAVEVVINETSTLGRHILDTANPHGVTKEQIGLSKVQNYDTATLEQTMAGEREDLYVVVAHLQAAIQNVVNGGMDAHILDKNNPHEVTAAQLNLGNVKNYAEAILSDIENPQLNEPKYITNISLALWLNAYKTTMNQQYATSLSTIATQLNGFVSQINTLTTIANTALTQAQSAAEDITTALNTATQALAVADENKTSIVNAKAAADTVVAEYVTAAVTAARAAGYADGYADGLAAH